MKYSPIREAPPVIKKSPAFYGTRTHITTSRSPTLVLILSHKNSCYTLLKIYFNIISSCMIRCPIWHLSLRISYQMFIFFPSCVLHERTHLIILDLIIRALYLSRSANEAPHYAIISSSVSLFSNLYT
jgi:hypothetical protein